MSSTTERKRKSSATNASKTKAKTAGKTTGKKLGGARFKKQVVKAENGITKPAIRRMARRGGVKRISGPIYDETRGILGQFLNATVATAVAYTEHAGRKTVTALDIVYAVKGQGKSLYGFQP